MMTLQDTYKSAGSAMIFQMSQRYAEYLISELYPLEEHEYSDLLEAIDKRFMHLRNLGWGEFKVTRYDHEKGVVMVQGKIGFSSLSCGEKDDAMCLFIKGGLVGGIGSILNKDFEIHLENCVEDEDRVECLFKLKTDNLSSI